MNEQLQEQLAGIIGSISTAVGQTKDFLVAELPPVVHEYLVFSTVYETTSFVLTLLTLAACLWVACKWGFFGKQPNVYGGWTGSRLVVSLVFSFMSLVLLICVTTNVRSVLLVHFAPKVYLLEKMSDMVRGSATNKR